MRDILRETLTNRVEVKLHAPAPEPPVELHTVPEPPVELHRATVTEPPVELHTVATPSSVLDADTEQATPFTPPKKQVLIEEAAATVASAIKPPSAAHVSRTPGTDASASPSRTLRIDPLALRGLLTHGAVFIRHRGPSPPTSPGISGPTTSKSVPRFVWCSADLSTLFWRPIASTDRVAGIDAASLTAVLAGKQTPALAEGSGKAAPEDCCFSLISTQESLDLQIQADDTPEDLAKAREARAVWLAAFRFLLDRRGGGMGRGQASDSE